MDDLFLLRQARIEGSISAFSPIARFGNRSWQRGFSFSFRMQLRIARHDQTIFPRFIKTERIAISAGLTPGILDACPSVAGETLASFSRLS